MVINGKWLLEATFEGISKKRQQQQIKKRFTAKRTHKCQFFRAHISQSGRSCIAFGLLLSTLHRNSHRTSAQTHNTHTRGKRRNKIIYRLIIISGWLWMHRKLLQNECAPIQHIQIAGSLCLCVRFWCYSSFLLNSTFGICERWLIRKVHKTVSIKIHPFDRVITKVCAQCSMFI